MLFCLPSIRSTDRVPPAFGLSRELCSRPYLRAVSHIRMPRGTLRTKLAGTELSVPTLTLLRKCEAGLSVALRQNNLIVLMFE